MRINTELGGVFKNLSNIYDGIFFAKKSICEKVFLFEISVLSG